MAYTAHSDPEMVKEHHEDDKSVYEKAEVMARWIRSSRHFIAFTGAGVSTSTGIPDFRGPQGVWTLRAQGKEAKSRTSSHRAIPSPSHMALVELINRGMCKYLISQNTDGLHRKSGVPTEKLSELHGNTNLEICSRCGKQYLRDYPVRSAYGVHEHYTGRKCVKCQGPLQDSIINFGEPLPQEPLRKAFQNAELADLCLVLGSSLTVSPANEIPKRVAERGGKLVIVNLQKTHLDSIANLRVFTTTDKFMQAVMEKLGIEIPEWRLRRYAIIGNSVNTTNCTTKFFVRGIEEDETPASIFRSVDFTVFGRTYTIKEEPFETPDIPVEKDAVVEAKVKLNFFGHYFEPSLELEHVANLAQKDRILHYMLDYNPYRRMWYVSCKVPK